MAISLIQSELLDDYGIKLSEDAIEQYIRRYQVMLAARQQDAESLRREYESVAEIILCIDGLQPEKGHETLYVVRELTRKRVWFAEPLISATEDEVRRLIKTAKAWAESLGTPVGLWTSDKQEAFVKGIAAEFPEVPHRYCDNHFLRDLAKPVLEADSHAKVQMRKKVRGLRVIEQAVLTRRKAETKDDLTPETAEATGTATLAGAEATGTATLAGAEATGTATLAGAEPPAEDCLLRWLSQRALWCSIIARQCVAFSMTIREGRCTLPACRWLRPWVKSRSRSNGTWTRKKGVRGGATQPALGMHQGGVGRSQRGTRGDPRIRRSDRGGGRDTGTRDRGRHRARGEVRGPDRSIRGDR